MGRNPIGLVATLFLLACVSRSSPESSSTIETSEPDEIRDTISVESYYAQRLLIGVPHVLKGYESVNIAGYAYFELDSNAYIIGTYDISNNFSRYTYDEHGRVVNAQNRTHTPPELYSELRYLYSDEDSTVTIESRRYKEDKVIETESRVETLKTDQQARRDFFKPPVDHVYLKAPSRSEIITHIPDMHFCCRERMPGPNELTYHLNADQRIDSLVISGIDSGKSMTFKYEYE